MPLQLAASMSDPACSKATQRGAAGVASLHAPLHSNITNQCKDSQELLLLALCYGTRYAPANGSDDAQRILYNMNVHIARRAGCY
jgi:hypothetical protein